MPSMKARNICAILPCRSASGPSKTSFITTLPSGIWQYGQQRTYRPLSTRLRRFHDQHLRVDSSHATGNGYAAHCRYYSTRMLHNNVFIALGSNIGDSIHNIEEACRRIDADSDMRIIDTSLLYETEPMYVEDQARFINGACEIQTHLSPMDLLDRLQAIEIAMGRQKIIDKGPRNVDLDIIGYADQVVNNDRLTIPHAALHERAFVLKPLNDLKNGPSWVIPSTGKTAEEHLALLDHDMKPIPPVGNGRRTLLMSILNVTPDSFSDGGKHDGNLQEIVKRHIKDGADIIDIGGQSSRPNAADVSAEEEIARVMPAIRAIEALPDKHLISVDTYRAAVAEAAVKAGATIVNDISAGSLDQEMLSTVAKLGCTYVMMHMRGTPSTMSSTENCSYPSGVAASVADELEARVQLAIQAGIRRWRIILDPGVGFAKNKDGNLAILRDLAQIRARYEGMPWLVGSSKKRFVGTITGVAKASDRGWGTAATVTAAIAGGADIVRVHDVFQMKQVVLMSDAIFRS